jgi:hypothetical protein
MTGQWDFYQCKVNSKPASIYLDMGLRQGAPDPQRPAILVVWLYLRHPHPDNGLSTDAEFDVLVEIEDRLSAALKRAYDAVYAGRITTEGRREFYFYSAACADIEATVRSALAPWSAYTIDAWGQPDAQWKQYLNVLYPKAASQRWMSDKAVITVLGERGDVADIARPLTHFSHFRTAAGRDAFSTAVAGAGFRLCEPTATAPRDAALPFGLVYELTQMPKLAQVFETTELLVRLSEKHGGEYDGWECPVTGPASKPWWRFWR